MRLGVLFIAFLLAGFGNCSVKAQTVVPAGTMQSPNLIYMTTNPYGGGTSPGTWSNNFTTTTGSGGGYSGGNQPAYNSTTGTFMFGYTQAQIAYTYALSTALKNSGMTWTGYNYSWDYLNEGQARGTLSANLSFNAPNGAALYSKSWALGPTTGGWTTMSGTESFDSPGLAAANLANFKLSFTGKDDRFWAGYYGPQVRNPTLSVNYTFDQCVTNPLSSPSCSGYADAVRQQACTANPLSDPSCPGYQSAKNAICSANPLNDPTCPGYSVAVRAQACTANPLSDMSCPGYQEAYKTQQCSLNPLYDNTCPGYATAYKTQQCNANPLYDSTCPGYAAAYKNQQCSISPLYDSSCPGYAAAFEAQQCTANPLYNSSCPNYAANYKAQQCALNPLYDPSCSGYTTAYHNQQCSINPIYATDCPGYQQAYLNAQCIKDSLYSPLCSGYKTAYAIKYLTPNIDSAAVNQSLSGTAAVAASNPTSVNTNGSVSTTPSATGNTTVDSVISTPSTTSTTSATSVSPAATNSVITPSAPVGSPVGQAMNAPQGNGQQAQGKQDDKGGDKPQSNQQAQNGPSTNQPSQGPQGQGNNAPQPTARQAIAERRAEQQKMNEMKQGKEMAENMKAATSMEQQRAAQGLVISAMAGYSPAFEMYKQTILFDAAGYRPYAIYGNQRTIDNRSAQRMFSGNDRLHSEMVEQQYNKGE